MNYLAHARHALDDPYLLAGTSLPDWLSVAHRPTRVRAKVARQWLSDADARVASLAQGIVRHHEEDDWFHQTPAFHELNVKFAADLRGVLGDDKDFRPGFLGHILVEILLDDTLAQHDSQLLPRYYVALERLDAELIEQAINRMAPIPTNRLAPLIPRFIAERFLYDYRDDAKLWFRLNQVMRRVGLPTLPAEVVDCFSGFRALVTERATELLTPNASLVT